MSQCPISSGDWRIVRARIDERRDTLRKRLEGNLPEIETALVRGRLAELRDLIAWGEPSETPTLTTGGDY